MSPAETADFSRHENDGSVGNQTKHRKARGLEHRTEETTHRGTTHVLKQLQVGARDGVPPAGGGDAQLKLFPPIGTPLQKSLKQVHTKTSISKPVGRLVWTFLLELQVELHCYASGIQQEYTTQG